MSTKRVIVAMSGGVDSAVAAGLLKQQGYDVIGITMRLWTQNDPLASRYQRRCCPAEDIDDAATAAGVLGIPHYVLNLEEQFNEHVVDYFVDEYRRGRTPNPCLPCNERIKFATLLERAQAFDADYLATGHYARVEQHDGRYRLLTAQDDNKDQSYVLYMLGQDELRRVLLPISEYRKDEIRTFAREMGLPMADKADSADICFLPTEDYRDFIEERVPQTAGNIVDSAGEVVGRHRGVAAYTVGQRRGLGIAAGARRFVTNIDPELNVITIGVEDELYSESLMARSLRWVAGEPPAREFSADVKIRYRSASTAATVRVLDGEADVHFDQAQRAVAPGQAVVFYREDEVLGGGIIESARRLTERKSEGTLAEHFSNRGTL